MKILFLHGRESGPGGTKPTYLIKHGFTVINPALPADDFDTSVRIAQAAFDEHTPEVVVGSSRGGAVAMNINIGDAGLVLLAPAWKKWGTAKTVKSQTRVIHSRQDEIVPFADSEDLVAGSTPAVLVEIGSDHRLSTPEPLAAMLEAVRTLASIAITDSKKPKFDPPAGAEFFIGTDREELTEIPFFSVDKDGRTAFFDSDGNKLLGARPICWDWSPVMSRADWLNKVEVMEGKFARAFGPAGKNAPLAHHPVDVLAAEGHGCKDNRAGGDAAAENKKKVGPEQPLPRSDNGGPTP